MVKKVFKVSGMHCVSCSSRVEQAVADLVGVDSAQVDLAAQELSVGSNQVDFDWQAVVDAVVKTGYQIAEESDSLA